MSWIVQRLLMDSPRIRETHDMDSDEYNDLLIIEKKINDMKKRSLITPVESTILSYIVQGYLLDDIENFCGISRETISKIFKSLCEKISYSIGGEFTDDGYIEEIAKRNRLTDQEQDILKNFMSSKLRHKVMRRPLKQNE